MNKQYKYKKGLKCTHCGAKFEDEDDIIKVETTYESYYGVAADFGACTPLTLWKCPKCHEEETIEEYYLDDDEGDSLNE